MANAVWPSIGCACHCTTLPLQTTRMFYEVFCQGKKKRGEWDAGCYGVAVDDLARLGKGNVITWYPTGFSSSLCSSPAKTWQKGDWGLCPWMFVGNSMCVHSRQAL